MKKVFIYCIILIILISISGCSSFNVGSLLKGPSSSKSNSNLPASSSEKTAGAAEVKTIPELSNNTEQQLEAGTYKGLTIMQNKVVLKGKGAGKTIIAGNVVIKGNNCVIQNLTIQGDVIIEGNNADLEKAQIKGKVNSSGKNNSW